LTVASAKYQNERCLAIPSLSISPITLAGRWWAA
jgi:hypothetical protein